MKVIDPISVAGGVLGSSSVTENDYAAWSNVTSYDAGDRVIKVATHSVYESMVPDNVGNDPAMAGSTAWLRVGATNRWAMFDDQIGTATTDEDEIEIVLVPGAPIAALGLIDVTAASVRVRVAGSGYDRTAALGSRRAALFLDLPGTSGNVTVTIAGSGPSDEIVAVGTLALGGLIDLGVTEAGANVGITDYSRRDTDDFGNTSVVERGWAKRMVVRSKIDSDAVDATQDALAAIRARPCLWIGSEDRDALIIYGYFKDFSIDLALERVSYCSLTVEGLTKAPPLSAIDWSALAETVDAALNPDGSVKDDKVDASSIRPDALFVSEFLRATAEFEGAGVAPSTDLQEIVSRALTLDREATLLLSAVGNQAYSADADFGARIEIDGAAVPGSNVGGGEGYPQSAWPIQAVATLSPGNYVVRLVWRGSAGVTLTGASLAIFGPKKTGSA